MSLNLVSKVSGIRREGDRQPRALFLSRREILFLHQIGLAFDGSQSLAQKPCLPDHRPGLQYSNQSQDSCKPFEFPLYSEILAALLTSLIAWLGCGLWGAGHRAFGGLLAVIGLGLCLSVLTTIGFCDPSFWRPFGRILTGQNPYRCQWDEHSQYRQTLQHDGGNVSQISIRGLERSESILDMDSQDTFFRYYGRFLGRLFKDGYEWPRDNILFAFFMVVVPPVAAWLRDPTHVPDWAVIETTGWIYLALFIVYAAYHVIRTPWKLDEDRAGKLATVTADRDEIGRKLKEIEGARPNIVLCDPGAEHIELVRLNAIDRSFNLPFVKVRFINKLREDQPNVDGHKIRAKLDFYDYTDALILKMDGRWSDSSQPSVKAVGESRNDLLPVDFAVEEAHSLDIAYWDKDRKEFVAWNNDSYDYPIGRKPVHILPGNLFTVEIRLIGGEVNTVFRFRMTADSNGPAIQRM